MAQREEKHTTVIWLMDYDCEGCAYMPLKHELSANTPCLPCSTQFQLHLVRPHWTPVLTHPVGERWPVYIVKEFEEQTRSA